MADAVQYEAAGAGFHVAAMVAKLRNAAADWRDEQVRKRERASWKGIT